jgi:hypothetical protein
MNPRYWTGDELEAGDALVFTNKLFEWERRSNIQNLRYIEVISHPDEDNIPAEIECRWNIPEYRLFNLVPVFFELIGSTVTHLYLNFTYGQFPFDLNKITTAVPNLAVFHWHFGDATTASIDVTDNRISRTSLREVSTSLDVFYEAMSAVLFAPVLAHIALKALPVPQIVERSLDQFLSANDILHLELTGANSSEQTLTCYQPLLLLFVNLSTLELNGQYMDGVVDLISQAQLLPHLSCLILRGMDASEERLQAVLDSRDNERCRKIEEIVLHNCHGISRNFCDQVLHIRTKVIVYA